MIPASDDLVEYLGIEPNTSLLHIQRVSYSGHDTLIEYLEIKLRGGRYTFYTGLRD